ncbi:16S rRNA (adenine(1518)-N(6)/adenine(1519)-N(6))-dimethyltransferase RsmA [Mesoterricola sediminis]|uniref:Ribosomal RNA small subunit methyltransferase A n=1 Tax=Mesoterricola sediminis TaxID=2927980 RepID=A0AA48GQ58_9BACT|nr:16S rRNA (adenine(1518)-N(6)/adenine(1519)-N(6))-dimethyltransferase RsmA [Mesoterricola sediminis]BDU77216.1 ribosomal RNA small subunit methyltransferase A [Mesoterricola sediminis]
MDPDPVPSLQPKKGFGQHFLIQASAIRAIVDATLAAPSVRLLEIGPGPGVLTAPLLEDGRPLWAVDLDPEAIEVLQARFRDTPHFHLVHGDAVHQDLPPGPPFAVAGNLPYNASTAILTRFLLGGLPWDRLVFMFQLEVAQKIIGRAGTKDYGPLAVLAQTAARVTRLLKLGPGAFRPAPKVDSAVLVFEPLADAPPPEARRALLALLHRSFQHRRKTLANNWQGFLPPDRIQALLASQGLPPAVRAEAVPPSTWRALLAGLP